MRHWATAPRDVEAYDLRRTTAGHTYLARMKEGMVGVQFWSVNIPGEIRDSGYGNDRPAGWQDASARRLRDGVP